MSEGQKRNRCKGVMEKEEKKPDLVVIEKSSLLCFRNNLYDKQGFFAKLWKFQIETVELKFQMETSWAEYTKHLRNNLNCTT